MNKVFKALIIGGLLIVVGAILAGIGVAASRIKGKSNTKADASDWVEFSYIANNTNISTLDIALAFEDVRLEPTTDKKISIVYKDKADNPTKIIEEGNNTLSMRTKSTSLSNGFFNVTDVSKLISESEFAVDDSTLVVISIPTDYNGKLYVSTASGDISVSDIIAYDEARICAISGNINLCDLQFEKETDIASTSGDILISNSVFNDSFGMAAVSGDISLTDTTANVSASATTTSGDIKLNNMTATENLQFNTISGTIKSNTTSANSIDIETTSGDIIFDKTTVETSFLASTVSGDCNIDFTDKLENYSTYIQTTSGDCNLPNDQKGGDKKLSITTTSGDMNITFADLR